MAVVLLPIVTLAASAKEASIEQEQFDDIQSLLPPSIWLSALIATFAVIIGLFPGKLLSSVRTGRGVILLLLRRPFLLPR